PAIITGEPTAMRLPSRNRAHVVNESPTSVSGIRERIHSRITRNTPMNTTMETRRDSQRTPHRSPQIRSARAIVRERDHGPVVDHLEALDVQLLQIARFEQAIPLRRGVAIGLRGERDVATVDVIHA